MNQVNSGISRFGKGCIFGTKIQTTKIFPIVHIIHIKCKITINLEVISYFTWEYYKIFSTESIIYINLFKVHLEFVPHMGRLAHNPVKSQIIMKEI